ncbi:hypothetical protein RB195_023102 [Necator americanus]|uniref:Uncharacterized protein n=1 Tax=Necator americanus TaxID=51031 RepID=A0ABR1EKG3_NECAM
MSIFTTIIQPEHITAWRLPGGSRVLMEKPGSEEGSAVCLLVCNSWSLEPPATKHRGGHRVSLLQAAGRRGCETLRENGQGLTSVEATKILMENQQYEMANEHVRKAVRLLEGNSSMCMQALYILVEIHFHMYQWEQLLTDADYLWIHVMKTRPKNVRSRRMLKDLEVFTVLVLQKSRVWM